MKNFRVFAALSLVLGLTAAGCSKQDCAQPGVAAPTSASSSSSATESTRAVAKRFADEIWGKKTPDAVLELAAPDLVNHAAIPEAQGAEGLRTIIKKVYTAFPDMKITVESMTVDGDRATFRLVNEGTQTAALEFKTPIPASNKHVRFTQMHELRIANGKVVEVWMTMDKAELLAQLR